MGAAIVTFLKKNLISLIAMVIGIIAAPVLFFFSTSQVNNLLERAQSEATSKTREIQQASTVTYSIPPTTPGGSGWEFEGAPHETIIEEVIATMQANNEAGLRVRDLVLERNRADKDMLLGSQWNRLFPEPRSEDDRVEQLNRLPGLWRARHRQMLSDARIGAPPDPEDLARRIERRRDNEDDRLRAMRAQGRGTGGATQRVTDRLAEYRTQQYQSRASELTAYGTPDMFVDLVVPPDGQLPNLATAWWWQFLTWVHEDVIAGVSQANAGPEGDWTPVQQAPVKRVLSIDVLKPETEAEQQEARTGFGGGRGGRREDGQDEGGPPPINPNLAQPLSLDFSASHTGRLGWPDATNGYYDVYQVEVELVADPRKLNRVIEGFSSVNFTTVVGLSYEQFNPLEDLPEGYVYGNDPVAQVSLRLETVWLRSWLAESMPPPVRRELRVPAPPEPEPEAEAEPEAEPEEEEPDNIRRRRRRGG
ncbi:MAG: hypothetical protein AAGI30_13865 [Planctomycetota bacterium]